MLSVLRTFHLRLLTARVNLSSPLRKEMPCISLHRYRPLRLRKYSKYSYALEIAVQVCIPTMISVAHRIGVPGFAHHRPRAVPRPASADNTPHSAILNADAYSVD